MDERLLVTPEFAAQKLSVSRSVVYELLAGGRLESIRIGRSRRIPVRALEAFISATQREQQPAVVA